MVTLLLLLLLLVVWPLRMEKKAEITTVVYKTYLHCPKCALDIQKPLLRLPGVQSVDTKFEKGEITVKGAIDAKKVLSQLQKWSKKKVEIISETKTKDDVKKGKETIKTFTMKTNLHCDECEREAKRRLLKHKGIHNVKTDIKAQTITVEGEIESDKLLTYMRKRVHKYAEIIPPKEKKVHKKEEKKEIVKAEEKSGEKIEEFKEVKKVEGKIPPKEKKVEKKEEEKEKVKVDEKFGEKIEEFKEVKKVEAKTKEGEVPYFIHYVYAPQLFSDENPNACSIT